MQIRTGDPEMAREINRALILDLLRKHETLSRAQIARLLDVSKATVSAVTSQLLGQQLVTEIGEGDVSKQGGRKPILLALDTASQFVLGVDVGYTNTVGRRRQPQRRTPCQAGSANGSQPHRRTCA